VYWGRVQLSHPGSDRYTESLKRGRDDSRGKTEIVMRMTEGVSSYNVVGLEGKKEKKGVFPVSFPKVL